MFDTSLRGKRTAIPDPITVLIALGSLFVGWLGNKIFDRIAARVTVRQAVGLSIIGLSDYGLMWDYLFNWQLFTGMPSNLPRILSSPLATFMLFVIAFDLAFGVLWLWIAVGFGIHLVFPNSGAAILVMRYFPLLKRLRRNRYSPWRFPPI